MEATVTYVQGMQFVGQASGHAFVMDAGPESGGEDTGVRPSELLLVGLGGCSGMDIISILKKKKQDVTGFTMTISGTKSADHPKRFTDIEIKYVITGRNVSEEAVKRAVDLSMTKYCSVKATLEGVAKIAYSYSIVPQ